jgi:RNA polymerase sigma-70 factor, ECF subfamily
MSVLPAAIAPPSDDASHEWLLALRADGATRDEAVARLHALLLRAARFAAACRRGRLPHLRDELEEVAHEAAGDALISVLATLLKDLIAEHAPTDALERELVGGRSR